MLDSTNPIFVFEQVLKRNEFIWFTSGGESQTLLLYGACAVVHKNQVNFWLRELSESEDTQHTPTELKNEI